MKKNKIVISIIISIGVILTVVALILNLSIKKEEALSIKTIKDFYSRVKEFTSNDPLELSEVFKEDGLYKISTNTEYKDSDKPINIKGNVYYDDKRIYSVLDANYNEEDFKLTGLLYEERLYFNIDKISNKYYYKDIEIGEDQLNANEVKELSNISFNILIENVENKTIKTETEKLKISNNLVEVEKSTVSLTGKEKNKIIDLIIDKVKESDKFKDSSKKLIVDKLNESRASSIDEDNDSLVIELYQKDNQIIEANLIDHNESIKRHIELYKTESDREYLNIETYKKDKKESGITITKSSARESIINIFYNDEYEINMKANTADNAIQINGTIRKITDYKKEDIGTFNIEFGTIDYQREYTLNIKVDINSSESKLKINSENKIYTDELSPEYDIDIASVKSINKMTPEEKLLVIKYFGLELFK